MLSREYKNNAKKSLEGNWGVAIGAYLLFTVLVGFASNFSFVGMLFLAYPLYYGYSKFNMALKTNNHNFDQMFDCFREDYFDNAVTIFLYNLFAMLWSLLLIIPGIIKWYGYSMVPYILVDNDYDVMHMEAIKKSQQMMYGHKMELFKLHLSFIGWHLLGLLTLGILNILYVAPWQQQATAHFYYEMKNLDMEDERFFDKQEPKMIKEIKEEDWDF